jgi:hypothetical protein
MISRAKRLSRAMLITAFLANGRCVPTILAQPAQKKADSSTSSSPAASTVSTSTARRASRYHSELSPRARNYYQLVWGVDSFVVKSAESGQVIRFSYRVQNAEKAKPVNDKKATPYLIDERAHVRLEVPTMEKVGQLRQSSTPEAGKSYWMVFSNKGGPVKRGDRVSVVIGRFRVDGLVVE